MKDVFLSMLMWVLNHPDALAVYVGMALAFLMGAERWKSAKSSDRLKKMIALADVVFHAVEEAARVAPDSAALKGAAKLAMFLDKLDDALVANGDAPLSDAERASAADMAASINARKEAAADPS